MRKDFVQYYLFDVFLSPKCTQIYIVAISSLVMQIIIDFRVFFNNLDLFDNRLLAYKVHVECMDNLDHVKLHLLIGLQKIVPLNHSNSRKVGFYNDNDDQGVSMQTIIAHNYGCTCLDTFHVKHNSLSQFTC